MKHFHTENHSDDCLSFYHDGDGSGTPDEYDTWEKWWPLYINGEHVADIMSDYGAGWEFHIRATEGHDLDVRYPQDAPHPRDCECDDCEVLGPRPDPSEEWIIP